MASYNWPAMGSGGGGGGVVTNAANVGTGVGLFQVLSGTVLDFRSITNGTGISWVQNVNDVQATISLAPFSTTNLSEGANLYFTQARARLSLSGVAPISYNNTTGAIGITVASAGSDGYLTQIDWSTFDSKQSALTFGNLTDVGTDGITVTGGTAAVIGSGTSISQHVADSTHNGYLSQTDWATFNNKQTALTFGNLTDVGTDGITVTGGTGSVIGAGTSISQHVADATHNGYLSSTDWNNFNTGGAPATPSLQGSVSIVQQSFGGLKKFQNGIAESGAVGFITADVTLTDADNRTQTISAAAGVTITMPTTSIKAGEVWTFYNNSSFFVYAVASDASAIGVTGAGGSVCPAKVEQNGKIVLMALINTPVSNADWRVVEVTEDGECTFNAGGDGYASTELGRYSRVNNIVSLSARFTSPSIAATTNAHINFEVPHPVTFATSFDASGVGFVQGSTNTQTAADALLNCDVNSGRTMTTFFYNGGGTADVMNIRLDVIYNLDGY